MSAMTKITGKRQWQGNATPQTVRHAVAANPAKPEQGNDETSS